MEMEILKSEGQDPNHFREYQQKFLLPARFVLGKKNRKIRTMVSDLGIQASGEKKTGCEYIARII